MALTADIKIVRYGVYTGHPTLNYQLSGSATVYRGSVALLSGSGASQGYLKNAASPASTDIVVGLIDRAVGFPETGPGITNPATTQGGVFVDVQTGTFFLQSGTGGDTLTVANQGATVYLINENTVGLTSAGGTRPVAGVLEIFDSSQIGPCGVNLGSAKSSGDA